MTVGERIRAARKQAGLTLEEVADRLGISNQSVAQWETGRRKPKLETLQRIADALQVPIESLLLEQTVNDQKDWRKNMDNNSAIAMLGGITNTVMDPEKMKAFEEKRLKDEARNQKIDDLTVRAVETMIHLMGKIDERIQNSDLTNEQLISLSGAMMTVSTSMGMLRAGIGWGYNGFHV